jgi:hypothetical protein
MPDGPGAVRHEQPLKDRMSTAATRMRALRARKRNGIARLSVDVHLERLSFVLAEDGFLGRHECDRTSGIGLSVGAGDRDRTDDIQLGKLTFYH